MTKIEEYIELTQEGRQKHLKLNEPCIERGGESYHLKGLLAHLLDTTIPKGKHRIMLCHACNNAKCSNPYHLYWGTPLENNMDSIRCGSRKNPWDYLVKRHGEAEARRLARERALAVVNKNRGVV